MTATLPPFSDWASFGHHEELGITLGIKQLQKARIYCVYVTPIVNVFGVLYVQHRPVTPEVAGSSPVAPVKKPPGKWRFLSF